MGAPTSGATWSPSYITYGGNNRTQMIRIPGPGRLEMRVVDGAANPYLATAALLAAGLDGIEKGLSAGTRNDDNLYELMPEELARAQMSGRLGEAQQQRRASHVAHARRVSRKAEKAARQARLALARAI